MMHVLTTFPLLSVLIGLPLFGIAALVCVPATRITWLKWLALSSTILTFLTSLALLAHPHWEDFRGHFYHVAADGLSVSLILLTTFLMPLCVLASWTSIQKRLKFYLMMFLLLESLIIGSFVALNLFLFYIFFEGTLIPMFFLIGIWGGPDRIYAAVKFFLYTFLGSLLMLIAILYVGATISFDYGQALTHVFPSSIQIFLWLGFFASFAVKMPIWPFHTWLPFAHVEAPTAASVILAGVLLKMGGYGLLRFSLPLFPEASAVCAPFVFVLAVIGVIYASFVALAQKDMKKLIAYASVAHMGMVTAGIFMTGTALTLGHTGSMVQMISHGLVSASLFLCVGVLYERVHTRDIAAYGGIAKVMPFFAVFFLLFTFANIGVPLTSGFVGEVMVIVGAFFTSGWIAFGLAMGLILGAAYSLWLYKRIALGKIVSESLQKLPDLDLREKIMFLPIALLVLWIGIYPKPLLNLFTLLIGGVA